MSDLPQLGPSDNSPLARPSDGGVRRPRPTSSAAASTPLPDRAHLHHLREVWLSNPLYFLTCCTARRRPQLASTAAAAILISAFVNSRQFHRWSVGRYVIMPDHVHFFGRPQSDAKPLSDFMRDWKKWTARELIKIDPSLAAPLWQPEFFDHMVRSADSYSEKWDYVRRNPVRAGLAISPETWPYAGECESLTF